MDKEKMKEYWKRNLRIIGYTLIVWFLVSYVAGILFVDTLNMINIAGYPLGFWFAQQGSILTFIALIFIYAKLMTNLDREFDVLEDEE
jgi:putative solute:sodium symporter small subunit